MPVQGTLHRAKAFKVVLGAVVNKRTLRVLQILEKGGRTVRLFDLPDERIRTGLRALVPWIKAGRGKALTVVKIDGHPARTAPAADLLREAGFVDGYKGLELEVW